MLGISDTKRLKNNCQVNITIMMLITFSIRTENYSIFNLIFT